LTTYRISKYEYSPEITWKVFGLESSRRSPVIGIGLPEYGPNYLQQQEEVQVNIMKIKE